MRSGHIKVKKGTRHLSYMVIARHTIESEDMKFPFQKAVPRKAVYV